MDELIQRKRNQQGHRMHRRSCLLTAIFALCFFYQVPLAHSFPADFDGDQISDLVVFRSYSHQVGSQWYSRWFVRTSTGVCPYPMSATGPGCFFDWGLPGDQPVTGDFDGDGKADFTVYRASTQTWFIYSSVGAGSFVVVPSDSEMLPGDIPDETDFNNDGISDITYYRPSTRQLKIRVWTPTLKVVKSFTRLGIYGELDPPTVASGNYHGQHAGGDATVRVPLQSTNGACGTPPPGTFSSVYVLAASGIELLLTVCVQPINLQDIVVVGNYGGSAVNLADFARWTPSSGIWTIYYNGGAGPQSPPAIIQWGLNGDIPVGFVRGSSGISLPAVWRPTDGNWFIRVGSGELCPGSHLNHPLDGYCTQQWGLPGDQPVY